MKFSALSVLCLLLSVLLCGAYPVPSDDDDGTENNNPKSMKDQIKEIFDKAASLVKEGFQKCSDQIQKSAKDSWTAFGDTAKEGTGHSLQTVEELMETMKGHVDDAMKEGHDHFQMMMDKAKEESQNIHIKADETMKQHAESMMDAAKKMFSY